MCDKISLISVSCVAVATFIRTNLLMWVTYMFSQVILSNKPLTWKKKTSNQILLLNMPKDLSHCHTKSKRRMTPTTMMQPSQVIFYSWCHTIRSVVHFTVTQLNWSTCICIKIQEAHIHRALELHLFTRYEINFVSTTNMSWRPDRNTGRWA